MTVSKKRRRILGQVSVCMLLISMMVACAGTERIANTVYKNMYRVDKSFNHKVFIRQATQDSALLHFAINTDQLLTKRASRNSDFQVELHFELFIQSTYDGRGDSLYFSFSDQYADKPNEVIYGSLKLPMQDTLSYEVGVRVLDRFSNRSFTRNFFLSNDPEASRFVTSYLQGVPSEYCGCNQGEDVLIEVYDWQAGAVELSYLDVVTDLAPPPFSISPSAVPIVTTTNVDTLNHDGVMVITCPTKGAIELRDLASMRSVRIPVFRPSFPDMSDRDEMMAMLKYLTTSTEYKEMRQSEEPRKAFEYFWLDCAGSRERAKVLIDNFYSRVEEANIHFSGLVEGWKTDRGLIHVIYGSPEQVVRVGGREVWFYGAERSDGTLRMEFNINNNYSLDRSLDYRQSWYLTVDSWRSGRTISQ